MCELNDSGLKPSDWIAIVSAIISFGSAFLLFKTYKNQKETSVVQNENLELDKKAKTAEYMPQIKEYKILDSLRNWKPNEFGSDTPDFSKGIEIDFNLEFVTVKNIIKIVKAEYKIESNKNDPYYNVDFDYKEIKSHFLNNYINPETQISINALLKRGKKNREKHTVDSAVELLNYSIFNKNHTCYFRLTIEDVIGNNYSLIFKKKLTEFPTNIIEYKKA